MPMFRLMGWDGHCRIPESWRRWVRTLTLPKEPFSMPISVVRHLLLIAGLLFAGASTAQEVTLPYRGLTLNARLEMAKGKTLADGVILITHGSLAHNDMELYRTLQEL
jgi:hypothetical protein